MTYMEQMRNYMLLYEKMDVLDLVGRMVSFYTASTNIILLWRVVFI